MSERRAVVLEVVRVPARAEGVEPHRPGYSLQEHIDTDSLERLAALEDSDWTLTFSVPGHEVTVDGEEQLTAEADRPEG